MPQEDIEVVITSRMDDADGNVAIVDLARVDRCPLPPFQAGAHVDVRLESGLVRQYSLCGDPRDRSRYRLGILREPKSRGGSREIYDSFQRGFVVRIGPPRNLFQLDTSGPPAILICGGIGITPILSMAHTLHAQNIEFSLHYCSKSQSETAFIAEILSAPFASKVFTYFSRVPTSRRFDFAREVAFDPSANVYVCGPQGLVRSVEDAARACGFRDDQLHHEFFGATAGIGAAAFEVEVASSGLKILVEPDVTVVAALSAIGIKVEVSCEQGVCGTCLCNVLDGIPDHRDQFLTEEEKTANDQMTLCCSRAKSSTLVLDL